MLASLEWSRWSSGAVFVAAVLVNLIFQLTLPASMRVDENSETEKSDYARTYEPIGRSLLAGHGFQVTEGIVETKYPPGYSIFVAAALWLSGLIGVQAERILSVFATLAMGISSLLLYALARRLWGWHAALLTPLLWMTYPFALWLTKQPNNEMPFLVTLFGAWYLFWLPALRSSHGWVPYLLCGLLTGIAMLIRPIAIGLGLVLGALLWLTRRDLNVRLRGLLISVLLAGNLIAVLPWELWLFQRTGKVVMLSTGGPASVGDGLTYALDRRGFRRPMKVPDGVAEVMRNAMSVSNELRSLRDVASLMGAELRVRPLAVAELISLKAARSWYATNSGRHENATLIQAGYFILLLWAGFAAWKRGGVIRQFAVGVGILVLYFWGMTIIALSILRYMVPAIGLAFLVVPSLVPIRQKAVDLRRGELIARALPPVHPGNVRPRRNG